MGTAQILGAVEALITTWQAELGSDVTVILGGSLVSDTFVAEGAKVIDVDVRFLVDDPELPGLVKKIEAVTGLAYRKTIQVGDWPEGSSTGHMIEGFLDIPGLDLKAEVEGCLRSRKYVGWHRYYQAVFSAAELAEFRADKLRLRGDKQAYKARKNAMRSECERRAVALGLVPSDRSP
jgi:hypothetical protein